MKIGFIGLGKMGGNMTKRLLKFNHEVVAWNLTQPEIDDVVAHGAEGATSHEDLLSKLPEHKLIVYVRLTTI